MTKKRRRDYWWLLLPIVVFIIMIIGFIRRDELLGFNPDKDICEEEGNVFTCQGQGYLTESLKNYCKNKILFEDNNNGWCCKDCLKWRPKTFCEKCIECFKDNPHCTSWSDGCEAKCVCDEYEEDKYSGWYTAKRYNGRDGGRRFDDLTKEQYEWLIDDIADDNETYSFEVDIKIIEGGCIKAHEANECEKGNSEWMWDTSIYGDECDIKTINETHILCIVCRKKTIKDLDCDQLIYEVKIEREHYCQTHKYGWFCFSGWIESRYSDDELIEEIIFRCI